MIVHDKPDCPLDHKCEKCGATATTVLYMYHLPTGKAEYRYMCPSCCVAVHLFQIGLGLEPVTLEESQ